MNTKEEMPNYTDAEVRRQNRREAAALAALAVAYLAVQAWISWDSILWLLGGGK